MRERLRHLWPAASTASRWERLRLAVGAFVGILCTGLVSRALLPPHVAVWLIAPMGASAVLVFGVPASPLAQPWSVVGGNTLSALVGIASARLVPDVAFAGALAVGLAIALMMTCRCLHPPGGASALYAVLSAPIVAPLGWRFALCPVLLNSVLLAGIGVVYNNATGRRYPDRAGAPSSVRDETRTAGSGDS